VNARQPLRVLLVSHYYPPHLGGIENVVRAEADGLARRGHAVTVLTSGPRNAVERVNGVRVVRIAAWNGLERRAGVPFPVLGPRLLPAALRLTGTADVVHVHDCLYPTSWAARLAAARHRRPYLLTQHVGLVRHPSALVRGVQHGVYGTAGRALLRGARAVITLNASVADFARAHGARPERMRHLANGVDTALFRPSAGAGERALARKRLGLPADRVLVLFVGRPVPKKGYDLLLRAAGPGRELVVAGEPGPAAPGVHQLGPLPPERLAEAYRACDVFALPSTAEGFPLTVQEAMASGLPVVTTDDPGYAPYGLDREGVALLPRDAGALRRELDALAGDENRRARMGLYAREYATRAFSWEEHVSALVRYYREALGGEGADAR
jgi:glycosyltransferase involved in cell wall biosynthesis